MLHYNGVDFVFAFKPDCWRDIPQDSDVISQGDFSENHITTDSRQKFGNTCNFFNF
jgi:hypothetical protein